jgi:hypothetical protein
MEADPLCASSFVRVQQVAIVLIADVGPEIIQQCFHDRQFAFVGKNLDYAAARLKPFYQFGSSFLVIMQMLNCAVRRVCSPRRVD